MTTTLDTVPKPIMPGAEMADLLRFHRDISWTGTIAEGGMGPGTPAMTASGSGTHTLIQDGRWVVGDYRQDQHLLDGTHVLTWQLHWVAGWDPALGEYRATVADCYGHAEVMGGRSTATDSCSSRSATHQPGSGSPGTSWAPTRSCGATRPAPAAARGS